MKCIVRSTLLALATLCAASVRYAMAEYVPAAVETKGASVITTILPDQSKVVKFLADGTFTVPAEYTARVLLVGGGGAGGMLEVSNVVLSAGTYTVTVGAGGQPNPSNSNVTGGNGGDTVLAFGGSDLYTAVGGGGGGSWGHTSAANGGSGGGATSNGKGGTGVEGQGYAGGTIELEPPENDNILNTLQHVIDALNDPSVTGDSLREALDRGQIHNLATLQSAGQALGRIGGRSNIAESVISSNDDLRDIKKEARATIAEADSVESASNLIQALNALSMAQRTFSMISQTSLMDYIS